MAALLVMAHHLYLRLGIDEHVPMLQWLLQKGYLGVDLFFVLSGFVMSLVYGRWFDGSRPFRLADCQRFVLRRVARLWPLHAVVLLLILLLHQQSDSHPVTARLLLANFAMVQAWGLSAALNPPAWSVSTEFFCYLLFPGLAGLVLRRRWGGWVGAAVCIAAIAVCMQEAPPIGLARRGSMDLYLNYSVLPLLRCLAGFVAGMLAWQGREWLRLREVAGTPWFGPAVLAVVVACMLGRVSDLLIVPLLPLVVLGFHFGRGPVHRALATGPLHGLGVLSYATYLLHYMLLSVFPFASMRLAIGLPLYFGTTVALAALFHAAVERPGRALVRLAGEAALGRGSRQPLPDDLP